MAKFYKVTLTEEERSELERIISIPNSKSIRTKRSYILLASDENGDKHWTDKKIQIAYGMHQALNPDPHKLVLFLLLGVGKILMIVLGEYREVRHNSGFPALIRRKITLSMGAFITSKNKPKPGMSTETKTKKE